MSKNKNTEWIAPIFVVLAIFAIWLALQYLPLSSFGVNIPTDSLWLYMPWIVAFAIGLYTLRIIYKRRH